MLDLAVRVKSLALNVKHSDVEYIVSNDVEAAQKSRISS
jgi:hypothetical protein